MPHWPCFSHFPICISCLIDKHWPMNSIWRQQPGWTTAAKVQSQTQRFRNQDAKSQGWPRGPRAGVWVATEGLDTSLGDWWQATAGLQAELGGSVNACRALQELAGLHTLLPPSLLWRPPGRLTPGHPHTRPPSALSVLPVLSARFTPFLCPNPTISCLANLYASFKRNTLCLLPHR